MIFAVRLAKCRTLLIAAMVNSLALSDELAASDTVLVAGEAKQVEAIAKPVADAEKDKTAAMEAKEQSRKERATRTNPRKQVGLDGMTAPIRALFGGPPESPKLLAPAVAAQNDPAGVADNDPMTLQFLQQFRPIVTAELGFIRLVCDDLPAEQRPKIKAAAEAGLKQAAKLTANQQKQGQVPIAGRELANPAKTIREAIYSALKETLSEAQMSRFVEEETKRTADRKMASIRCIVARLDGELYLTDEQREKIEKGIASRWQDDWEKWIVIANVNGGRYFPLVPDQCVVPHLTSDQATVWSGIPKIDIRYRVGNIRQLLDNDGWWGQEADGEDAAAGARINRKNVGF